MVSTRNFADINPIYNLLKQIVDGVLGFWGFGVLGVLSAPSSSVPL